MHELGVTDSIIQKILTIKEQKKLMEIIHINLKVGRLSGFEKESLQSCFDMLKAGTDLEKTKLVLIEIPIKMQCHNCHEIYFPQDLNHQCPQCHFYETLVIEGREFMIDSIEAE